MILRMTAADTHSASRSRKVLIAAGRPTTRSALRSLLDSEPGVQVVGEAVDVLTTIRALRTASPDVLLVGTSILGDAGLKRLSMLAAEAPGVPIFVVGMGDHPRMEAHARAAGAAGYVRLDEAPERLSSALASLASPTAA
jgi:DNA-binding NarL/FixJ family response regulator